MLCFEYVLICFAVLLVCVDYLSLDTLHDTTVVPLLSEASEILNNIAIVSRAMICFLFL